MTTTIDLLATAIRIGSGAPGSLDAPVVILGPDRRQEWAGLIPVGRSHTSVVLALGDVRPNDRRGPAVRLRCEVDHAIDFSDFTSAHLCILASSTCRA